jgi:glycosyltransferase involved in cell wall biosynthesis
VFIEAMYYGKLVIAGNKDGSVDALDHGRLGILVNPDDTVEITDAIVNVIRNGNDFVPDPEEVRKKFSYPVYKENLRRALTPGQSPLSP